VRFFFLLSSHFTERDFGLSKIVNDGADMTKRVGTSYCKYFFDSNGFKN